MKKGMYSKFIPNNPVIKLSGSMIVAMIVRNFMTSFILLFTMDKYESSIPAT